MTNEEAIEVLEDLWKYEHSGFSEKDIREALDMAIQALTAISELSKSLKAVNRYDMDEKVLIGFNMAVAIFNRYFGEIGEMPERQTDGDLVKEDVENADKKGISVETVSQSLVKDGYLISRTDLLNKIWQKEYGKDYDGVNMLDISHIDIIEQMPSAENTAEWIDGKCNKCGTHAPFWSMSSTYYCSKYCPECGARMKRWNNEQTKI